MMKPSVTCFLLYAALAEVCGAFAVSGPGRAAAPRRTGPARRPVRTTSPPATLNLKEPEVQEETPPPPATEEECAVPEEQSETQKLMVQVKAAGPAGVLSYALWELGFWTLSVPVCVFGYREVTGHWPDFGDAEDQKKLAGEAFAFVNFARFAVPLRIGLALGTTPWIKENVMDRFFPAEETEECVEPSGEE